MQESFDLEKFIFSLPKRTIWTIRILLWTLIVGWVAVAIYLHHEVKESRAKVEQSRIEEARRQEFLRRGAQYKQDLQERTQTPRVRNVFDGR